MGAGVLLNSELRFYGEKIDNKNSGNVGVIRSQSHTVDGQVVVPLGEINQLVTLEASGP